MPLPLAMLDLAGLPALQQIGSGIGQASKARKLKLQDTRPESFKEELAMRRLAANNQRLPGQGAAEERIAQGEANAYAGMLQTGTSSANVLAGLSNLNRNSAGARNNLSAQAAQFQQGNQERLVGSLRQDANYRQQDRQEYNRSVGALKEASNRNIFGGLSTLGSIGAYGLTGGFNTSNDPDELTIKPRRIKKALQPVGNYDAQVITTPYNPIRNDLMRLNYLYTGNSNRMLS